MDTTEFNRLRVDFLKSPLERWGSATGSIGAVGAYLLLLLLLYLFVDLLVWKGEVPSYAQLPTAKQQEFAAEWAQRADPDREEAVRRLGLLDPERAEVKHMVDQRLLPDRRVVAAASRGSRGPTVQEWELRWRAGVYLALKDRVNPTAAETYLPELSTDTATEPEAPPRLGLLSLVVRERGRWTGRLIGWLASWNTWSWRPGEDGTANPRYLAVLFVLAFGIALVRGVLLNAVAYFAASATLETVTRLRRAIYFHIYRLGSLAVRTAGPAETAELATRQVEEIGNAVEVSVAVPILQPIKFLLLVGLILLLNFWLAVSFLLLALLVWVIGGQIAAYNRREARIGSRQAASALALLQESMSILRLVKCYHMERFNQNRVERQLAESRRANWRRLRGDALARPVLRSVALVAGVALAYLGARAVLAGEFSVAGLVVMAVTLVSMVPPLVEWLDSRRKLRRGREAATAVFEFLDRRGEATEAADAEFLPALTTRLEFRHVSLKEPGTGRMLLENISLAIPVATRVAIVGVDTTAKHALISLIPRFLDPTSGEIRIEDKNIKWVTHESLRAQIAVVMQDDLVFTDTVANNIGCGDLSYNLPQIIEAAKLAHAHQFIERLPFGYETRVGNQGHSLKPGEQFRIGLARALLRDPNILIIEEPTAPVDEDTLALLDDTIERVSPGRTFIFLANRLSTLRSVHRVFLLKDGHLEASGSHRDLWQNNEFYRRLNILADATLETSVANDQ